MKSVISILLPSYKSGNLLNEICIPSIFKNSSIENEIIIYDNGGNKEFFSNSLWKEKNNIKIIGDGENIGLNAALNKCAEVAEGSWFYLLHTDMYVMLNWDTSLLEITKNHPLGSQLLCSRSIEGTKGHTEFHLLANYGQEWNEFDEDKLLKDFEKYKDETVVTGYRMPFFMHRCLWDRMNGVDPNYFSYCTDDDLVQTAYHVGARKFWMVYNSLVYHLQGKSNIRQTVDKDSREPYIYFVKKWKKNGYLEAQHPGQWHPQLVPWYIKVR